MHMADALISPQVGITMLAVTVGVAAYSIHKVKPELDEKKVPLMGVMGAFVFAAQMINFTIPGTGSSGHIAGGILLSALLGPYAGFLTLLSVILVQALFFADGGLLAYGANVFNMGFFACFLAYPLILKLFLKKGYSTRRIFLGSLFSSVAALQLGALCVVLETLLSGKTELPFATFVSLMQPIHLAIGIVEGLVTAAIVTFVWKARPEILQGTGPKVPAARASLKKVIIILMVASLIVGGVVSWFASTNPDGLEWSIFNTTGLTQLAAPDPLHSQIAQVQQDTAILPDYGFKQAEGTAETDTAARAETSVSGIIGVAVTLVLALAIGVTTLKLTRRKRKKKEAQGSSLAE
ncbi:MAG: energy-coupling factor ABC transporter permease [Eubacteriales bacterium]